MFRCNLPDSISLTMACVAPYVDVRIHRSNYRRAYLDSIQPIKNPIPWQLPRKAQYLLQHQVNRLMPHSAITPQLHFFGNLARVRIWLPTWILISTYKLDHIIMVLVRTDSLEWLAVLPAAAAQWRGVAPLLSRKLTSLPIWKFVASTHYSFIVNIVSLH